MAAVNHWLLLDTSGRRGLIALVVDDHVLASERLDDQRKHARDLAGAVDRLTAMAGIKPRQLTGVAVSIGPGSFTGLRVGVMSAKALAYASGCRLVSVPIFHAIAQRLTTEARIHILADGQKGQVYHQAFTNGVPDELTIMPFSEWRNHVSEGEWVSGPALTLYRAQVPSNVHCADESLCEADAESMWAVVNRFADADVWSVEPLYLRGSSAEEQWKNDPARGASGS